MATNPPTSPDLQTRLQSSAKATRQLFASDLGAPSALQDLDLSSRFPAEALPASRHSAEDSANRAGLYARVRNEYADCLELPPGLAEKNSSAQQSAIERRKKARMEGEGL
ncbi:MAG: hypothetical protein M1828_001817 [Chrysothrix sp. TS-e1954]|nr:MAG: hypothetical protein M1828_001817 [Chrysothrix sp. TS-e1954]